MGGHFSLKEEILVRAQTLQLIKFMKTLNEYPPNIEEIRKVLTPPKDVIFTYGDTLYNPDKIEIPDHLYVHEETHKKQQTDPIAWWDRYLKDSEFRLEQELEAYVAQYVFFKETHNDKQSKLLLEDIATHLSSSMYGNIINFHKAESRIRHSAKNKLEG